MSTPQPRAKRRYLIIPLIFFGVIFAAYSAVWVYGSKIMVQEVDAYIAAEKRAGRSITYTSRHIEGYPFSLRTQIDGFTWQDPGQWSWSGERLYIITLPYDVTRLILAPRKAQRITYDGTDYAINADTINIGLKQNAYSAEASKLMISDDTQSVSFGTLRANWNDTEKGWVLSAAIRQGVYRDPNQQVIEIPFWNFSAHEDEFSTGRVMIDSTELAITDEGKSPPTQIEVTGAIGVDAANRPDGQVTVSLRNEKTLFDILLRYGVIDQSILNQAQQALALYKQGQPTAEANITFRDGQALFLGVIPIAQLGPIY